MKSVYSKQEKAAALLLFFANLAACLSVWMEITYDRLSFDQILFLFKAPLEGVQGSLSIRLSLCVGAFSVFLTTLEVWLYQLFSGRRAVHQPWLLKLSRTPPQTLVLFTEKHSLLLVSVPLLFVLIILGVQTELFSYVKSDSAESGFIETNYVNPDTVSLRFPEKKRNLIYLFLESMESTYADPSAGDPVTDCYIPELVELAEQNTHFSHTDSLGGALSYPGTTWTAAAMVAQTSGVVLKVSLKADTYGSGDVFLPGVKSIGQILEEQGYNQVLLLGSNAEFHGRETYFREHGNYEILDIEALKEAGRLPEDYNEWWGFEDQKLFSYAREELTRLANEGAPFNFTMLTADTHFPDGCRCSLCEDVFEEPYANVLACSSRQVSGFVAWIKKQPFYENTTIVISGDHLTMDAGFMDDIDPDYARTIYNCFIHPAVQPINEKNRQFGSFDLFPTTLAAMGVEIGGDRLGLGTNLFSGRKTLTEQYGYKYLAEELQKQSDFYDEEMLEIEPETD